MEPTRETPVVNNATTSDAVKTLDQIAEKRSIIPIAFAAVIVLFFFSFVNFKCNGSKVASVTGFNLVTGSHIKTPMSSLDDMGGYFNEGGSVSRSEAKGEKVPSSNWAILAFLSAIAGVGVYYKKVKKEAMFGFIIGIVGVVSLLVLRWAVKDTIESQAQNGMVSVEADFAFGYWMALLMFIIAGGVSYLRMKKQESASTPVTTVSRGSGVV